MKKILIWLSFVILSTLQAQVPERPSPPRLYNNLSKEFPEFLNAGEAAQLEEKLQQFSNSTSNQICVVIVDELYGDEAASLSFKIGNEWGVGKKGMNNGIVVLVKPTGSAGGRDLAIAVGYGLEGAIPDLATKRVRENEMYPYLKTGDNFTALDKGTEALMKLAKGEINVKDYTRHKRQEREGLNGYSIVIIIIVVIIILLRGFGGGGTTYSRGGRTYWGGGFGGGSWGGGGSSSSGGGWGGFGGGSFGGGGSSGKW